MPLLEAIDTLEELQTAAEDPPAFMNRVMQENTTLAQKLALQAAKRAVIRRVRPVLEPKLLKQQLAWTDVLPALETVDTPEEIEAAISEPEAFLSHLMTSLAGPVAKKMAIARLQSALEPHLQKHSLEWVDVLPLVAAVDSLDELQVAISDPRSFATKLAQASTAACKKLAKHQLMKRQPKKPPKQKFEIDKAKVPVELQRLYALFFDASSKMNLVSRSPHPSPHSHSALLILCLIARPVNFTYYVIPR